MCLYFIKENINLKIYKISAHVPMGVITPCLAMLGGATHTPINNFRKSPLFSLDIETLIISVLSWSRY